MHAKYSPSQLSRIIACPGSVKMCETEVNETSSYAEEGTMLHAVMEKYIDKWLDNTTPSWPSRLTKEQTRACENAFEYFEGVYMELNLLGYVKVTLEGRTSMAYLGLPDCDGTADVVLSTENERHIIDWKFGQGIEVSVTNNTQFMAYALGSFRSIDDLRNCNKIMAHVVQPRLSNYGSVEYIPQELIDWADLILAPALQGGPCVPGESQCRWCLGKMKCKERHDMMKETATQIFEAYAKPIVTDEDLVYFLDKAKQLEVYIKDIKARALTCGLNGMKFPGHKVVLGRSARVWKNEKTAQQWLEAKADEGEFDFDEIFISKFISAPQAEKLTKGMKKDKEFKELYIKTSGKPTLAKDNDPREEYRMDATTTFDSYK